MTIPHYKIVEIGGKNLVVFYPQFKDGEGYKIIDLENRFPIELKNEEEYKMFLEAIIISEDAIKDGLKTLADLVDEMSLLAKGPKGDTRFMWVKYADDEQGNGMSDDPTGKKYIGMAFNKDVEKPSNNASDYKWVKYVADYEGLEIGGRNLIGRFNFHVGARTNAEGVNTSSIGSSYIVKVEPNTEYVITRETTEYNNRFRFYFYKTESDDPMSIVGNLEDETRGFVQDEDLKFSFKTMSNERWLFVYLSNQRDQREDIIDNKPKIKLEKGTVATDWSPAIEDIFARIDNVDKAHVGLSNVQNYGIALESQAKAGVSNATYMTPLRTKQAIDHQRPTLIERKSGNVPADDYPTGISFMDINGGGTSDGYPQNYGTVITYKSANNRISQEFIGNGFNSSQEVKYTRHYHPNNDYGGWTEWKLNLNEFNAFVVDSGIVKGERYVKYADGKMEVMGEIDLGSVDVSNASGNVYRCSGASIEFETPFSDDLVYPFLSSSNSNVWIDTSGQGNRDSVPFRVFSGRSSAQSVIVRYLVYGRWD